MKPIHKCFLPQNLILDAYGVLLIPLLQSHLPDFLNASLSNKGHIHRVKCVLCLFYRAHIQKLEVELAEYRQGKIVVGADGNVVLNDISEENTMLRAENDK